MALGEIFTSIQCVYDVFALNQGMPSDKLILETPNLLLTKYKL